MAVMHVVKEVFSPLCCKAVFEVGEKLRLDKHTSKNRAYVIRKGIEVHKVKLSTFNRCCEPIEDVI